MASDKTFPYKSMQIHLLYRFAITKKMERRINMGAVMGAHRKSCQIIQVAIFCSTKALLFRFWIPGIDLAGENFLGNIINLHSISPNKRQNSVLNLLFVLRIAGKFPGQQFFLVF